MTSVKTSKARKGSIMNNASRKRVPLGCVLVSALLTGCPSSDQSRQTEEHLRRTGKDQAQCRLAREKGIREAKAAIADGTLKLKEYPPTPYPPGHGEYTALLRDECGVEYEVVKDPYAGPGHSEELIQEVRAWNETMRAEIMRKFGQDVFQRLHDEVKKRWDRKGSPKDEQQPNQSWDTSGNGDGRSG